VPSEVARLLPEIGGEQIVWALKTLGADPSPAMQQIVALAILVLFGSVIITTLYKGWSWGRAISWGKPMGWMMIVLGLLFAVWGIYTVRNPAIAEAISPKNTAAHAEPHVHIKAEDSLFVGGPYGAVIEGGGGNEFKNTEFVGKKGGLYMKGTSGNKFDGVKSLTTDAAKKDK